MFALRKGNLDMGNPAEFREIRSSQGRLQIFQ